ncbi:MAG: gamma-glutamyltransferase [Pseudomonadota bacterium]
MRFYTRYGLLVAAAAFLTFSLNASGYDRISSMPHASRSEIISTHGMAATSQPLATQIAIDVLKRGGSAVDAAIAANAALGLMEPTGCGIGGDLYAIVWDAEREELTGLNASGRSPQGLTLEQLQAEVEALDRSTIPPRGPLPVSVPGAVDGWFMLHERYGRLPMKEVLAPAIGYAQDGFPVSELIAYYWERNARVLSEYKGFEETFMPGGKTPAKGDVFRNPRLANTYAAIAEGGRDAFYSGPIAEAIADYVQEQGGYITVEDLEQHRSDWVTPVSTTYRGVEVFELPPNGQGIAALQILNILEGFDIASMGFGSDEYVHTFVEAKKLAFEDRAKFYADMDFVDVPVDWLISKEYAQSRRAEIGPKASKQLPAGDAPMDGDTIYLTVADADGNMVSLIQSNYRGMGSGMTPGDLGFILQDRGELFSLDPAHANAYEPGKRPFHTIIPAFAFKDGKPWLSFGLMGGGMQPQGHAQIIVNMIDFGMNLQEAGDAARIRHDGSSEPTGSRMTDGGTVYVESGIPEATRKALEARGHEVKVGGGGYGGYQAIIRDHEQSVYYGASEVRKDGQAAGY